jgi:hypothetical protein
MPLALFAIGKFLTTESSKRNILNWSALIFKISQGAQMHSGLRTFDISHWKRSDNHVLLSQRSISQEQALDYFHGRIACQPNAMHSPCFELLMPASAITPEGNVVKGAGVIVEMWKRLPVFRFLAPLFESGIGSIVISSGRPLIFCTSR